MDLDTYLLKSKPSVSQIHRVEKLVEQIVDVFVKSEYVCTDIKTNNMIVFPKKGTKDVRSVKFIDFGSEFCVPASSISVNKACDVFRKQG